MLIHFHPNSSNFEYSCSWKLDRELTGCLIRFAHFWELGGAHSEYAEGNGDTLS